MPKSHRWLGALHRDKKTHLPFEAGLGEGLVFISTAAVSRGSEQSQGWRGCALWAGIEKWGGRRAANSPMLARSLDKGHLSHLSYSRKVPPCFSLWLIFALVEEKKIYFQESTFHFSLFALRFSCFLPFLLPFINLRSALSWLLKPILVVSNRGR